MRAQRPLALDTTTSVSPCRGVPSAPDARRQSRAPTGCSLDDRRATRSAPPRFARIARRRPAPESDRRTTTRGSRPSSCRWSAAGQVVSWPAVPREAIWSAVTCTPWPASAALTRVQLGKRSTPPASRKTVLSTPIFYRYGSAVVSRQSSSSVVDLSLQSSVVIVGPSCRLQLSRRCHCRDRLP